MVLLRRELLPPNPGSVVFAGRLFDFHLLDMMELGIEKFASLSDIKVNAWTWATPWATWSSFNNCSACAADQQVS